MLLMQVKPGEGFALDAGTASRRRNSTTKINKGAFAVDWCSEPRGAALRDGNRATGSAQLFAGTQSELAVHSYDPCQI